MNSSPVPRRRFVQATGALGAILALGKPPSLLPAESPGNRVVVGVMGLSRGMAHVSGHLGVNNVEVAYVCDVDSARLASGLKTAGDKQPNATRKPQGVGDFRRMLDDKNIDAISIAAPNFWHAPAAILAMQAGKHVYVEKPGSHNPWEAEAIVAAAAKYNRKCQMGNQRRSYSNVIEGIQKLREGVIGKVLFSRCYYTGARPSINKGIVGAPPATLNWELWQGPAPERPYKSNIHPYNWHWHWHYGGGEMANNGIHALDVSRWGLGVDYPKKVTFLGGRYHWDDDQETPDTGSAVFDFGHCGASWDDSSCNPRGGEKLPFVSFYGDKGSMTMSGGNDYTVFDPKGKELDKKSGGPGGGDIPHFENFSAAIRENKPLNSPITEGQKGSLMCHLANISYRTSSVLNIDSKTGRIVGNPEAQKLWKREYRPGWEPKV